MSMRSAKSFGKSYVAVYFTNISAGTVESELGFRLIRFWETISTTKGGLLIGLELLLTGKQVSDSLLLLLLIQIDLGHHFLISWLFLNLLRRNGYAQLEIYRITIFLPFLVVCKFVVSSLQCHKETIRIYISCHYSQVSQLRFGHSCNSYLPFFKKKNSCDQVNFSRHPDDY